MHPWLLVGSIAFLYELAWAQYLPPEPQGITVLKSKLHPGTHICETTPNVRAYSGYVHLPSTLLEDAESPASPYNISTFFWFFESRHDPSNAPLSIWLAGGPGASSLYGPILENGPCYVNSDSNSTVINPWSWNNHVNMLYIDQPVQVGFSYDQLINGTLDQTTGTVTPVDFSDGIPFEPNNTLFAGTFSSNNVSYTANTTSIGARALWHFAQSWFVEFPKYKPHNDKISLWTNSYGGYYGPGFLSYFLSQNSKIESGDITNAQILHLDTLGITNGCIDMRYQVGSYPQMAYNNTYGFKAISESIYEEAMKNYTMARGCKDMIDECQELAAVGDPDGLGANETVVDVCAAATAYCFAYVIEAYDNYSGRSPFDIAHPTLDPYPPYYGNGFFNQGWVQKALGVPVNYTQDSAIVEEAFFATGDPAAMTIKHLESVLDAGVKVAMVYGDRDHRCNWIGAENVSLNVEYSESAEFRAAGYEYIVTNKTYNGGVVRQYGNFSFSRVFEAGHDVTSYQPETAYRIFMRAMFDTDIATGSISTVSNADFKYQTSGPSSSWSIKNKLPEMPAIECNIWGLRYTCTDNQIEAVINGTAVVKDYIVLEPKA
ncbi:MAG: hypothetical protein M1834_008485 [Cirrosporium novae-zelandiae]|nr:MAG: hypothetical protein M1834_008485 [Cirrosporium novae-zelandiae]